MKPRTVVIVAGIVLFAAGVVFALMREIRREEATLQNSISGRFTVARRLYAQGQADVVKTDRLALYLVDPQTREPVALRFISPLGPPQAIRIGQDHARGGGQLEGSYLLVGITDKDGEVFRPTPGEVYGRSDGPVPLGAEEVELVLDQPYRGHLFNESPAAMAAGSGGADAARSISGTVRVAPELAQRVTGNERLVVLLFDPGTSRPVAWRILPQVSFPQDFSVGVSGGAADAGPYELRIVTDLNNDPFGAAPGELVGRSAEPVELGTSGVEFVLDQPYQR